MLQTANSLQIQFCKVYWDDAGGRVGIRLWDAKEFTLIIFLSNLADKQAIKR